jgi:two-component system sensor histidine kinase MprB
MSAIVAGAVALAVVAVAIMAWILTRSALLEEVDRQLTGERDLPLDRAEVLEDVDDDEGGEYGEVEAPGPDPFEPDGPAVSTEELRAVQAVPMTWVLVNGNGDITDAIADSNQDVPIVDATRELLQTGSDEPILSTYSDPDTGEEYRVLSSPRPEDDGGVAQVMRSLNDVNDTLDRLALLLTGGAVAGVALAGVAGWWVSRSGLRPVDRLTRSAEQVADSKDLSHRIPVDGRDEIARLGKSINKMLEELDAAREQQRQLVEDAGHELRTPLATLRTDVGLLLRSERAGRELDPADREELLTSVEAEIAALSGLVAEVVDLAKGDVDDEQVVDVDVRELVENAVDRTRRVNLDIQLTMSGESVIASLRPATIERAVSNLVRNALQVTPAGRGVQVEVHELGPEVVIVVSDEGPGIATDDLPRIFDRFYRGHDAREKQGSGLGLAIVKQAVDQHGGAVTAANSSGSGARMTIRLPKVQTSGNS